MTAEATGGGDRAALGAARVEIVEFEGRRRVVKTGAAMNECVFYGRVADRLRPYGIETPRVFECDATDRRLVLEYVPQSIALPADHPALLARLARLHEIPAIDGQFHDRVWTDERTRQAADLMALDRASRMRLTQIQAAALPLFSADAMICGDSNPGNWARRQDGTLVQFDWERFGRGHPALDIAPLAGMLPDRAQAEQIAAEYLRFRTEPYASAVELGQDTRIAVAWLTIDVICLLDERRHPMLTRYRKGYARRLPSWLAELAVDSGC